MDVETERPEAVAEQAQAALQYCAGEDALKHAEALVGEDPSPEGLEKEIARLRGVLEKMVKDKDVPLMLSAMDVLRKMILAQYRMSKKAERDLSESIANVLRHYASHVYGDDAS